MGKITLKVNRLREIMSQLQSISDIFVKGNLSPGELDSLTKQIKIKKSEAKSILNQVLYGDKIYILNIKVKATGKELSFPFKEPLDANDISNFMMVFNLVWGDEAEFVSLSDWYHGKIDMI